MLKKIVAIVLAAVPAVAQQPIPQAFPPYAPWMLPDTPGFNQKLLAPMNVTANSQMAPAGCQWLMTGL